MLKYQGVEIKAKMITSQELIQLLWRLKNKKSNKNKKSKLKNKTFKSSHRY